MTYTIGSLCAGYDGIALGLASVIDAHPLWVSEFDPAASKILAYRYPDAPNLGDMTKIDWSTVPRVDIIAGGTPCQDLSHAGKRAGMTEGTRSNLWVEMREAIATIRPRLVVWENVRGALSAEADSDLEPCPGCVGGRDDGPVLRALGRVLGDLADLGYDARWYGLRAADVGAPHGRFRVFVFALMMSSTVEKRGEFIKDVRRGVLPLVNLNEGAEVGEGGGAERDGFHVSTLAANSAADLTSSASRSGNELTLLPTPRTSDTNGAGSHGEGGPDLRTAVTLLPTPAVNDMGEGKTVEAWDERTAKMKAAHGNGNGHGKSLAIETQRLLPTPRASDGTKGGPNQRGSSGDLMLPSAVTRFGDYAPAIARWERLTRPAPDPTEISEQSRKRCAVHGDSQEGRSKEGPREAPSGEHCSCKPRLSPRFCEWMMGLPDGWVTDPAIGITRNDELKALGNGVVPQQCAAAFRTYLADEDATA